MRTNCSGNNFYFLHYFLFIEFTLGDDIIAAPVVVEGAIVRDIYLPKGEWTDGNTNKIHKGPIWLMEYPAPIDTLPFFVRRYALSDFELSAERTVQVINAVEL